MEAIDPTALDAEPAADREILLNNIRAQLLQLEVIRGWEKNPDNYSTGVTNCDLHDYGAALCSGECAAARWWSARS